LLSAIDEFLEEFGIQTGIDTELVIDIDGDMKLSSIAEVQLVCILQEALTNVRKHSRASQVKLVIARDSEVDEEYIRMQVSDDGKGFVIEEPKRRFGLQTMRERASSVEGKFWVDSIVGRGTTITCEIPCLSPEALPKRSIVLLP